MDMSLTVTMETSLHGAESDEASVESVEWDWMTGIPITHLSFAFNEIVSPSEIRLHSQLISKYICGTLTERFLPSTSASQIELWFSGGSFSGLCVPFFKLKSHLNGSAVSSRGHDGVMLLVRKDKVIVPAKGCKDDKALAWIEPISPGTDHLKLVLFSDHCVNPDLFISENGKDYLNNCTVFSDIYTEYNISKNVMESDKPNSLLVKVKVDVGNKVIDHSRTGSGHADIVLNCTISGDGDADFVEDSSDKKTDNDISDNNSVEHDEHGEGVNAHLDHPVQHSDFVEDLVMTFDQPYLHAFKCPVWPSQAEAWRTRPRISGWPDPDLVKDIASHGCHIVPEEGNNITWRYTFPQAEWMLAQHLSDVQRQCYILLRMLHIQDLDSPGVVTPADLIMLLFWQCEDVPLSTWTRDNLSVCFLALLDRLIHCLIDRHLPHYFLPGVNILRGVHEDFTMDVLRRATALREDPLAGFCRFNQIYEFISCPHPLPWSDMFEELRYDFSHNFPQSTIEQWRITHTTQGKILIKVAAEHIKQANYEQAYTMFEKAALMYHKLGQTETTAKSLMSDDKLIKCDLETKCHVLEFLTEKFPGCVIALGNLACSYYTMMCTTGGNCEERIDQTFTKLIQLGGNLKHRVDYSIFLFNNGQFTKAVNLLLCLPEEADSPVNTRCGTNVGSMLAQRLRRWSNINPTLDSHLMADEQSSNYFGKFEHAQLDENLQLEVDVHGEFQAPSTALACYQLIRCYLALGETDKVASVITTLSDICASAEDKPPCYILLGYSYMLIEDHAAGEGAFNQVLSLRPSHQTASDNLLLCQAMEMSLCEGEQ